MPYCVQCGKQVSERDQFCSGCGARQGGAAPNPNLTDFCANLSNRTMMQLCYIPWVGWAPAIFVIASHRFRTEDRVRFHAFQGLYLFVIWLIADWFLDPMMRFGQPRFTLGFVPGVIKLSVLAAWLFMLVKVRQGVDYRLPVVGELAEKSVAEQRF